MEKPERKLTGPRELWRFYELLDQAFESANAVDMFDLHSKDPVSMAKWRKIRDEEVTDVLALIDFVVDNAAVLREQVNRMKMKEP